jgi:hypothetical protein
VKRLVILMLLAGNVAPALAADDAPAQVEEGGRSGFWTSRAPAKSGSEYRYRMLGIGVALVGVMGFTAWRLVKRAQRERPAAGTWPGVTDR